MDAEAASATAGRARPAITVASGAAGLVAASAAAVAGRRAAVAEAVLVEVVRRPLAGARKSPSSSARATRRRPSSSRAGPMSIGAPNLADASGVQDSGDRLGGRERLAAPADGLGHEQPNGRLERLERQRLGIGVDSPAATIRLAPVAAREHRPHAELAQHHLLGLVGERVVTVDDEAARAGWPRCWGSRPRRASAAQSSRRQARPRARVDHEDDVDAAGAGGAERDRGPGRIAERRSRQARSSRR